MCIASFIKLEIHIAMASVVLKSPAAIYATYTVTKKIWVSKSNYVCLKIRPNLQKHTKQKIFCLRLNCIGSTAVQVYNWKYKLLSLIL